MDLFFILALLLLTHYIGDIFIQIYTWRTKTKWVKKLVVHTLTYISVMAFGLVILQSAFPSFSMPHLSLMYFLGVNAVIHFIVDFFVKKASDVLFENEEITAYANVIALDQALHYVTLLITFGYFFT